MRNPQIERPITADGELEVILQLDQRSTPPSGMSGPPENYDCGCGPEWSVVGFRAFGVFLPNVSTAASLAARLLGFESIQPSKLTEGHRALLLQLSKAFRDAVEEAIDTAEEPELDYED